ncbi:MAG: hypothetical protein QM725_09995 [Lacibacter sp.]
MKKMKLILLVAFIIITAITSFILLEDYGKVKAPFFNIKVVANLLLIGFAVGAAFFQLIKLLRK